MQSVNLRPANITFVVSALEPLYDDITAVYGTPVAHGGTSNQMFRLPNGNICIEKTSITGSRWSIDGGLTWSDTPPANVDTKGPMYSSEKGATIMSGTRINAWTRTLTDTATPDLYNLGGCRRGDLSWLAASIASFAPACTIADSVPITADNGTSEDGYLKHKGSVWTKYGPLLSAFYGTDAIDTQIARGYPTTLAMRCFRGIALETWDEGATFINKQVIFDPTKMDARANLTDSGDTAVTECWPVHQEGYTEIAAVRTIDDYVLFMARGGGRAPGATKDVAPVLNTPPYIAYALDDGTDPTLAFTNPRQIITTPANTLFGGRNPQLLRIGDGVLVSIASEERGTYAMASVGTLPFRFEGIKFISGSADYTGMVRIGFDEVLLAYRDTDAINNGVVCPVRFHLVGAASTPAIDFYPDGPWQVPSGGSSCLTWFSRAIPGATPLELSGGSFGAFGSGTAVAANSFVSTGALVANTTYRLFDTVSGQDKSVTIGVLP